MSLNNISAYMKTLALSRSPNLRINKVVKLTLSFTGPPTKRNLNFRISTFKRYMHRVNSLIPFSGYKYSRLYICRIKQNFCNIGKPTKILWLFKVGRIFMQCCNATDFQTISYALIMMIIIIYYIQNTSSFLLSNITCIHFQERKFSMYDMVRKLHPFQIFISYFFVQFTFNVVCVMKYDTLIWNTIHVLWYNFIKVEVRYPRSHLESLGKGPSFYTCRVARTYLCTRHNERASYYHFPRNKGCPYT